MFRRGTDKKCRHSNPKPFLPTHPTKLKISPTPQLQFPFLRFLILLQKYRPHALEIHLTWPTENCIYLISDARFALIFTQKTQYHLSLVTAENA
jgi:hypothetical protein